MPQKQPTCAWCGKEIASLGRGRPRKYCGPSCRQRAYEQRKGVGHAPISEEAVVLSPEKVASLHDGLFELRCAAEDIATAASEEASYAELQALSEELVALARKIEKLR